MTDLLGATASRCHGRVAIGHRARGARTPTRSGIHEAGLTACRGFPRCLLLAQPWPNDGRVGVHDLARQRLSIGSDDRLQRDQLEESMG